MYDGALGIALLALALDAPALAARLVTTAHLRPFSRQCSLLSGAAGALALRALVAKSSDSDSADQERSEALSALCAIEFESENSPELLYGVAGFLAALRLARIAANRAERAKIDELVQRAAKNLLKCAVQKHPLEFVWKSGAYFLQCCLKCILII